MSYKDYQVSDIPLGKSNSWEIKRFEVSKEDRVRQLSSLFSTGRCVPPGIYTGLYRNNNVIMSDTPDEIADHYTAIHSAKGNVLIAGLGLGMYLNAVAQKSEVNHITVIEKSADVMALVKEHYNKKYPNKITFILADIFDFTPVKDQHWDYGWFDIWDNLCEDNLEEMTKLARKFSRKITEKGYWGKALLLMERRRRSW